MGSTGYYLHLAMEERRRLTSRLWPTQDGKWLRAVFNTL